MIEMTCPRCAEEFEIGHRDAGHRVTCPYCKAKVSVPGGEALEKERSNKQKSQWPWLLCFFLTLIIAVLNVAMCTVAKTDSNLTTINTMAAFWTLAVFVLTYCVDRRS